MRELLGYELDEVTGGAGEVHIPEDPPPPIYDPLNPGISVRVQAY